LSQSLEANFQTCSHYVSVPTWQTRHSSRLLITTHGKAFSPARLQLILRCFLYRPSKHNNFQATRLHHMCKRVYWGTITLHVYAFVVTVTTPYSYWKRGGGYFTTVSAVGLRT
jgi:hypothetical protein